MFVCSKKIRTDNDNLFLSEYIYKSIPFFSSLPTELIPKIAAKLLVVKYKKGDYLFREGSVGDSCYILYSGEVDIVKATKFIVTLKKDTIFGETAVQ